MLSFNDKISTRQFQMLLVLDILGTGIIVLPRKAAEFAAQDGWVVIAAATLAAMLYMYVITTIGQMFPRKSFYEVCSVVIAKPAAMVITAGFVVKIMVTTAMELRFFAEITKQTLLYNTPIMVIFASLLCVSALAASKGYEARARMGEILLPIVLVPLAIVFIMTCADVDFTNLLPLMKAPAKSIAGGAFLCGVAFTGLEFALLAFPYLNNPQDARKAGVSAIGFIGVCMTLIVVITIAKFGPLDVKRQMWPVIELMDVIDFPGAFIERQDALIISFWIISVFSIINAGLFFSAIQIKNVVKKGRHSVYIGCCAAAVFLLASYPTDLTHVYDIMNVMFRTFGIAYMVFIPAVVLTLAKMRGLGEKRWRNNA